MDGDGLLRGIAFGEIVALQHARHGMLRSELDHVGGTHLAEPLAIETHLGALTIKHLEDLLGIRLRIGQHILASQRLAGDVLAGGVTDHAGEVANQEDDLMPQILELAHFVEQHGVAKVQIGRSGVKASLDPQRPAAVFHGRGQTRLELFALEDFVTTTGNQLDSLLQLGHWHSRWDVIFGGAAGRHVFRRKLRTR